MSASNVTNLADYRRSDEPDEGPDEQHLALLAALRAATSRDEAAAFRSMLGLDGAK